jgi:hypothetical protein
VVGARVHEDAIHVEDDAPGRPHQPGVSRYRADWSR